MAKRIDKTKLGESKKLLDKVLSKIAQIDDLSNITEKVVVHRSRKYGVTKFGLERFIIGFLDLLTITFMSRFGKKPMHFFGILGTLMFLLGFGYVACYGSLF